jgi:hypothetical protein
MKNHGYYAVIPTQNYPEKMNSRVVAQENSLGLKNQARHAHLSVNPQGQANTPLTFKGGGRSRHAYLSKAAKNNF